MSPKRWLYTVPLRLRSIFRRRRVEQDLDDELQYHLEMRIEENIAKGMSSEEARRAALIALGGLDQRKEECRDMQGIDWLVSLQRNFRHSFRRLAKAPVLSLVVILSLGLGIGSNTAIFSLIYQILLRPLPVENPDELALGTTPGAAKAGGGAFPGTSPDSYMYVFSYLQFRELERHQQQNVAELAASGFKSAEVALENQKFFCGALMVSGGYFPLMRTRPHMGRTLIPADDQGDGIPAAMLGYGFWKNKLGGRPDILNKPIRIFGQVFTVVGVAPKGFCDMIMGAPPDVILPLATATSLSNPSIPKFMMPESDNNSHFSWIYMMARIKRGVTREQAAAFYAGAYAASVEQQIQAWKGRLESVGRWKPGTEDQYRKGQLKFIDGSHGLNSIAKEGSKTPIIILMLATGLVLFIAMANAANLLLARSAARRGELAICAAMGASRSNIVGQLFSEAMTLAIAGGIVAIPLSLATLHFLISMLVQTAPLADFLRRIPAGLLTVQLEWPVFLYCMGLSLLTGLLFGLYPALAAARVAPNKVLNQESGQFSEALGTARMRKALVCAQVVISIIVLIPTGLFLKSLVKLMTVDPGLRTENLVMFRLLPNRAEWSPEQSREMLEAQAKQSQAFFEQVESEVAAIPGVTGLTSAKMPLLGGFTYFHPAVEGYTGSSSAGYNEIAPGFFRQMGIPLLLGREFTEHDNLTGQMVAIVNEQFVKTFFAGQNPIGRRLGLGKGMASTMYQINMPGIYGPTEIVGVVKDSFYSSIKREGGHPNVVYTPWRQNYFVNFLTFYVRSALPSAQVFAQIRNALQKLNANVPVEDLRTMEEQVELNISNDRQIFQLAGIVTVIAMALAMMGLYGVMAYSVIRRTREIGIRMAIGAKPAGIRRMVLREMMLILAIGLVLGIPAGLSISRVVASQLFSVSTYDPFVVAGASLALGLAAFAATYLPAWRASRVDPLNALRCE
jgi:predicted permease